MELSTSFAAWAKSLVVLPAAALVVGAVAAAGCSCSVDMRVLGAD